MSLLTSEVMKTLVRRVLERAESEGGEEWLKRCLAGIEAEAVGDSCVAIPAQAAAILEEGEVVSPIEMPPASVPPSQTPKSQRSQPLQQRHVRQRSPAQRKRSKMT